MIKVTLQEANPELAKQWHPTKNGNLTPNDTSLFSSKQVWWKCIRGHEWQAKVSTRSRGHGCPYCSGRYACNDNCLETLDSDIAKQWHPTKNGNLTPKDVTKGSYKKVWWICDKGHEWQTTVNGRSRGAGCPYCSRRYAGSDNCLATLDPILTKQWHPTKNGDLTPRDVLPGSHHKVWWICDKGHEWQAIVKDRYVGGCPYCSGKAVCKDNCLETLNPSLAKQWHPTKNGELTPRNVTTGSHHKVWWICDKGHKWQAVVSDRSNGTGCPFCSRNIVCIDNCLETLNPSLAKQWHPTKNGELTPRNVTRGSNTLVWWICDKGHEWQAAVKSRNAGRKCPYCLGKAVCKDNCLATLNPKLAKQWHPTRNGDLTPQNVTPRSQKKVWWVCSKGHEWQSIVDSRSRGSGCPHCYAQISQLELRIYCELKYLFPSTTSKQKIYGKECDVYIPELKFGVEVDGLYWHRNKLLKDKEKSDVIRSAGITLIRVREAGLKKTSDTDIFYTPKDGTLTVIKKIAAVLDGQYRLNSDKRESINKYLQRHSYANDSEYKNLWDMLPSPFPGLSLAEQRQELAREWHPTKNGSLTPRDISLFTSRTVWWICDKGHEWQTTVNNRSSNGSGCPYCIGRAVYNDNCLATLNPDIANQWHPTKNGDLTPRDVTTGSNNKVWWICDKGHEWQAEVGRRSKGSGCPYCLGQAVCEDNCLATLNPDIAKQWHPTKNGDLTPRDVTTGSNNKVWWICDKGHEWQTTVKSRSRGSRCPYCSGKAVCDDNCLATLNPDIAKQWHPTKNGDLTPQNVTTSSHKKVWWRCDKGHEWQTMVSTRSDGSGCPYCSGNAVCADNCLETMNPGLAKQWHPTKNGDLTPRDVTTGSDKKFWWRCDKGHEWETSVSIRSTGHGCPQCWRFKRSKSA